MAGEPTAPTGGGGRTGGRLRPVNAPRPVAVFPSADGTPRHAAGRRVETVRDAWRVDDAWWTGAPVRRRYYELVLDDGTLLTVYADPDGRWWRQRA